MKEAAKDESQYLMGYYNWRRPHKYNEGIPPAIAEKKLILCPEIVDHYTQFQRRQV